jgi:hypothetical protein
MKHQLLMAPHHTTLWVWDNLKGVLVTVSCGCAYWRVDGRERRWLRESSAIRTVAISVKPPASPIMPDHAAILNYVIASRRMSWPQKPPCSRLRADSHYTLRFRSISVPSDWSVFTLSVVFSYLPERHVIGGLRLSPLNYAASFVF